MANNKEYDTRTLIGAAVVLIAFAAFLYFLPDIMLAVGRESPWLAGAVIAAVLVLPFVGLWLRARARRGDR